MRPKTVTSEEAYTRVLADFEYLLKEVMVKQQKKKNYFISALMDDYMPSFNKNRWMLRQAPEANSQQGKDAL